MLRIFMKGASVVVEEDCTPVPEKYRNALKTCRSDGDVEGEMLVMAAIRANLFAPEPEK